MFFMTVVLFIVCTIVRTFVILFFILASIDNIHKTMSLAVLRSKILFFDSNPIGRILTRFSKDIVVFD